MDTYLFRSGQQLGPYPEELLKKMHGDGQLQAGDLVWDQGSQAWIPSETMFQPPELPSTSAPASESPSSSEPLFLQEGVVIVTKSRFINADQTYLLSGVTSIRAGTIQPRYRSVIGVLLLGLLVLLNGVALLHAPGYRGEAVLFVLVGAVMIGLDILHWRRLVTSYVLTLTTAAQEVQALKSRDPAFIQRVVDALNKAVVARG